LEAHGRGTCIFVLSFDSTKVLKCDIHGVFLNRRGRHCEGDDTKAIRGTGLIVMMAVKV